MRSFKDSFIQQFVGGFALGAVALVTFQPAEATRSLAAHLTGQADASARR